MLESLFKNLCKIGTLLKLSAYKTHSPSAKNNASTKSGIATATSGDNSPVYIGGSHTHNISSDKTASQSETKIDLELRFKNNLTAVAHELPWNFRHRGNPRRPFITHALEKLVYDEPMTQKYPVLYEKASQCLHVAKLLSTTIPYCPGIKPSDGQRLMKDLANFISTEYGIEGPVQE